MNNFELYRTVFFGSILIYLGLSWSVLVFLGLSLSTLRCLVLHSKSGYSGNIIYLGLSLVASLSIMVYLNTLTMLLAFVKLQALTAISCPFDPLPGVFENRGSYLEF